MLRWLIRYRTEAGGVYVAAVLAGQKVDAWVICIRHHFAHHHDMPVQCLKYRVDGQPNLAKGAYVWELTTTEKEPCADT